MTPKEKAQEIFDKYYQLAESIEWTDNETKVKAEKFNDELGSDVLIYWNELAKKSGLIAVDEILELVCSIDGTDYWQEYYEQVKHEIEKL